MLKAPTLPLSGLVAEGTPAHQDCRRRDGAGGLRVDKEETQEWQ